MSISAAERDKMLSVPLCGPRVVKRLERIGIQSLTDLAGRDPHELVFAVNHSVGHPIWRAPMATHAMANLIDAARQEATRMDR
jgi:hypothetical protein